MMGISWRLPLASSWSTSRVTLAALSPSAVFTMWVIPRPWSFAHRDCDNDDDDDDINNDGANDNHYQYMFTMRVIPMPWSFAQVYGERDYDGDDYDDQWLLMLAMVVLMIMIINTLSKMKFSSSHLQVVQVLDSFDVSNKQVRMNLNGSGRLRKLSLKMFEKQICISFILS